MYHSGLYSILPVKPAIHVQFHLPVTTEEPAVHPAAISSILDVVGVEMQIWYILVRKHLLKMFTSNENDHKILARSLNKLKLSFTA